MADDENLKEEELKNVNGGGTFGIELEGQTEDAVANPSKFTVNGVEAGNNRATYMNPWK